MASWSDLFTQGTLISFSTHLWRARIRLTAEDLGIDATEDVQKAFSFGCHRLAPHKAFEEINAAVTAWMQAIMDHSLAFPLLDGVRYVPDTQVPELQRKLDLRFRDFNIAVEHFLADYDAMMDEMLPTIEKALHDAAKTPEAANTAFSRVIREYPSAEKIAAKFGLEWNFFTIAIPTSKEAAVTAKTAIPQVQQVLSSMIEQLRTELNDKVGQLISLSRKVKEGTSKTKDGFGSRTKESLQKTLAKVERLNVLQDPVLEQQIQSLKNMLSHDDIDVVLKDLQHVKTNLEQDSRDIAAQAEKRLTGLGSRKLDL